MITTQYLPICYRCDILSYMKIANRLYFKLLIMIIRAGFNKGWVSREWMQPRATTIFSHSIILHVNKNKGNLNNAE